MSTPGNGSVAGPASTDPSMSNRSGFGEADHFAQSRLRTAIAMGRCLSLGDTTRFIGEQYPDD